MFIFYCFQNNIFTINLFKLLHILLMYVCNTYIILGSNLKLLWVIILYFKLSDLKFKFQTKNPFRLNVFQFIFIIDFVYLSQLHQMYIYYSNLTRKYKTLFDPTDGRRSMLLNKFCHQLETIYK